MSIAYLNGEFLPLEEAHISPMDRGFLFGDGIYDFIPVYGGKLFRFKQHIARLNHSLKGIALTIDHSEAKWKNILTALLEKNGGGNASIYLQITRGAQPKRELSLPKTVQPTIFAYCTPLVPKSIAELSQGFSAITREDNRWLYCHIKAITLLANVLLKQQAIAANADETILYYQDQVTECTSSNVFIVQNDLIITPKLTPHILGGITRQLVIELCQQHQLPYVEKTISIEMLRNADEIWISSSSKEVLPIVTLDGQPINHGKAGPVWHKMITLYRQYLSELTST